MSEERVRRSTSFRSQRPAKLMGLTSAGRFVQGLRDGSSPGKSPGKSWKFSNGDSPQPDSPLKFDPIEQLRRILQKEKRTKHEVQILLKYVENLKFFQQFKENNRDLHEEDALVHLVKNLGYEKFRAGEAIFKEGDYSNGKMYIIFTGEVVVIKKQLDYYTSQNIENQEGEIEVEEAKESPAMLRMKSAIEFEKKPSLDKQLSIDSPARAKKNWAKLNPAIKLAARLSHKQKTIPPRSIEEELLENSNREVHFDIMPVIDINKAAARYGKIIDRISTGGYFGEKALESDEVITRGATIMASMTSEFLTISTELYNYIRSRFERNNKAKLSFMLEYFPFVEKMHNQKVLENLLYLLEEKVYHLNNLITLEGGKGKEFFIIYDGVCEIYKRDPDYIEPNTGREKNVTQTPLQKGNIFVCSINRGVFFGEEILFNKSGQYEYTIRAASSTVTVIAIEKAKFNLRFPQGASYGLRALNKTKQEYYHSIFLDHLEERKKHLHSSRDHLAMKKHIRMISSPEKVPTETSSSESTLKPISIPQSQLYQIIPREKIHSYQRSVLPENYTLKQIEIDSPRKKATRASEDFNKLLAENSAKKTTDATIDDIQRYKFDFGKTYVFPRKPRNPNETSREKSFSPSGRTTIYESPRYSASKRSRPCQTEVSPEPSEERVFIGRSLLKRVNKIKTRSDIFNLVPLNESARTSRNIFVTEPSEISKRDRSKDSKGTLEDLDLKIDDFDRTLNLSSRQSKSMNSYRKKKIISYISKLNLESASSLFSLTNLRSESKKTESSVESGHTASLRERIKITRVKTAVQLKPVPMEVGFISGISLNGKKPY
mgnify:CR=1 FL=1